jgi:putative transposase
MKKELALNALKRAIAVRRPSHHLLHHSDRGSQYCSDAYRYLLDDHGFTASMSGKGNSYDNSMVETVFKTIKAELILRTVWCPPLPAQVQAAIARTIDGFCNPKRRHSALGHKTPIQFESHALKHAA